MEPLAEPTDLAIPHGQTGPRTPEGKSIASRNAVKNGLFAAHDFIREDEFAEYSETQTSLYRELSPVGHLEIALVDEVVSASWRLRRCRLVEATHGLTDDESVAETLQSVGRARSHAHNTLRRSLAELRKLQTERSIRFEIDALRFPALTESRHVLAAVKTNNALHRTSAASHQLPLSDDDARGEIDAFLAQALRPSPQPKPEPQPDAGISFCKEPKPEDISFCKTKPPAPEISRSTPRNAPCPCKSGQKYKRCCARGGAKGSAGAPPVLPRVA